MVFTQAAWEPSLLDKEVTSNVSYDTSSKRPYKTYAQAHVTSWTAVTSIYSIFTSCVILFMAWPMLRAENNSSAAVHPQISRLQPIHGKVSNSNRHKR